MTESCNKARCCVRASRRMGRPPISGYPRSAVLSGLVGTTGLACKKDPASRRAPPRRGPWPLKLGRGIAEGPAGQRDPTPVRSHPPRAAAEHMQERPSQHGMEPMQQNETDREARLRELASKLFFSMENQGGRPQQPVLRCSVGLHVSQTFGARTNSTSRPLISITTSCPAT